MLTSMPKLMIFTISSHQIFFNLFWRQAVNALKNTGDSKIVASQANEIVNTYLEPGVMAEINISDTLRDTIKSMVNGERLSTRVELLDAFNAAQNETIKMMAMGAFPRFLRSSAFIQYRALNHTTDAAVQEKMNNELDLLLANTSWLSQLLNCVETLPICVSLAAASKQLSGFPLIYVNACFEKTTGYPRNEIIGQNCRFLQMGKQPGHISEEESIRRLSTALRDGNPIKVAITNFRKDGTPFRNLLAMKPIFDDHGNYAFVLGIQFDISDKDASPSKMKIIDDLFRILPDTIECGPTPPL